MCVCVCDNVYVNGAADSDANGYAGDNDCAHACDGKSDNDSDADSGSDDGHGYALDVGDVCYESGDGCVFCAISDGDGNDSACVCDVDDDVYDDVCDNERATCIHDTCVLFVAHQTIRCLK